MNDKKMKKIIVFIMIFIFNIYQQNLFSNNCDKIEKKLSNYYSKAVCYYKNKEFKKNIDYIKSILESEIDINLEEKLRIILALSYLKVKNTYWALMTLNMIDIESKYYNDALSILVWINIKEANIEEAKYLLEDEAFNKNQMMKNKKKVFLLYISKINGNDIKKDLKELNDINEIILYEEDSEILKELKKDNNIKNNNKLNFSFEVNGGYSSNPFLVSEKEDIIDEKIKSSYLNLKSKLFFSFFNNNLIVPTFKLNIFRTDYYKEDAREINQLSIYPYIGFKINILNGLEVFYNPQLIRLDGDTAYDKDGYFFRESHLIESNINLNNNFIFLFKGGYSKYYKISRSNWEISGGLYIYYKILNNLSIGFLLMPEINFAKNDAYDLYNISSSIGIYYDFSNFEFGYRVSGYYDVYPHSGFYYNQEKARKDLQIPLSAIVKYNIADIFDVKAEYIYTKNYSNIEYYDSKEHRFVISLIYNFGYESSNIKTKKSNLSGVFNYINKEESGKNKNINPEELLRRDELERRNSSCINN